ncbi:Protein OXIDATIVE STRESS 3 LIKE 1 [Linum perenne]
MSIAIQKHRRMSKIEVGGAASPPLKEVECSSPSGSSCSTSSSSSIGKNSDCEEGPAGEKDEEEVQSAYRGGLDLGALKQTLPHSDLERGGLSKCYAGKAKSFSDLGKAESIANISEIEKTEHALNKRRRNEIALKHVWDRSCGKRGGGGAMTSCRSALSLATTAMDLTSASASASNSRLTHHNHNNSYLPPLYPGSSAAHHKLTSLQLPPPSPMRSISMADLHYFSTAAGACASTNFN